MKTKLNKRLFNVNEAAIYLGRSPGAIRELQYKGVLPFVKEGARIQFDVYDLDDFIEKRKQRIDY